MSRIHLQISMLVFFFSCFMLMELSWVVVSNIFYVHPYLGKIPILTNIFQMGWNHQLVRIPSLYLAKLFLLLSDLIIISSTMVKTVKFGDVPSRWVRPLISVSRCWHQMFGGAKMGGEGVEGVGKKIKLGELGVSKNNGTPKWMVYNGKPY